MERFGQLTVGQVKEMNKTHLEYEINKLNKAIEENN